MLPMTMFHQKNWSRDGSGRTDFSLFANKINMHLQNAYVSTENYYN